MFRNYLLTALRGFRRNKAYTAINVAGLTAGLACAFFIVVWVRDELRFDRYHEHRDRIYRVMRHATFGGVRGTTDSITKPLDDTFEAGYPAIEHSVLVSWESESVLRVGDRAFRESGRWFDPDVFEVFSLPLIVGDPKTVLLDPGSIAVSRSVAERLFGPEWSTRPDLLGTTIRVDNRDDMTLTGVFDDVPSQSSLRFDFVLPMEQLIRRNEWVENWGNSGLRMWVMLREGADVDALQARIKDLIDEHVTLWESDVWLQPLSDVYLRSDYEDGRYQGGRIEYVRVFSLVAIFILLIASINFMNLATARSARRAREIGVRKSVGATRRNLARQFLGESVLSATFSFALAAGVVALLLGSFNELTGKDVALSELGATTWLVFAAIALATGVLAGSYPALYLSSFNVASVIRAGGATRARGGGLRRGLVVFQFTMSVALITGTLTVYRQLSFIRTENLGLDRENVVTMELEGDVGERYESFRNELLSEPGILSVAVSSSNPLRIGQDTIGFIWEGKSEDNSTLFSLISAGYDFLETMRIELVAGRDFSEEFGSDSLNVIVNERTAAAMGVDDPIGRQVTLWGRTGTVIGMVKDFHMQSLYDEIEPVVIRLDPPSARMLFVRTAPGRTQEALAGLERVARKFNPEYPFDYEFLDTEFESMYRSEAVISRLANVFAAFAVLIACLGLFGLASYTAEQRTREIGIRKVLGARVSTVVLLLSREFVALVAVAFVIAAPVSWLAMDRWLGGFAYHASFGVGILALAGLAAVVAAAATVSWQSFRAAVADPVAALRG